MFFLFLARSVPYKQPVHFFKIKSALLNVSFQELVTKVFQQMWFTPLKNDENSDVLVKRVVHMTDVVSP